MEFHDGGEPSITADFDVEDEETDVEEDDYGQDEVFCDGPPTGSSGVYSGEYDGGGYDEEMEECRSFHPFTLGQQHSRALQDSNTVVRGRTTFRMAAHPYRPRAPTATTSSTKDKNMLSRIRSEIAGELDQLNEGIKDRRVVSMMLKAERYNMKINYHSRGRELDFLKAEHERDRVDAELTHRRQQESKQREIEHEKMKLQLAELETQQLVLKIN
ncbi:hypothetical protein J3R82DRAFT_1793 [Butyriboletus roseoflavus]|nr:hypothetical protein J3R82DRAFT_1793 [Butyriboletus roseoflavus]